MLQTPSRLSIRLAPEDDVVVARVDLLGGLTLPDEDLVVRQRVPAGHKVAVRHIAPGAPVRKYGQIIGIASAPIAPGDHVHTHNLGFRPLHHHYEFCVDAKPTAFVPQPDRATFDGIVRSDGRVATRNYIGVITSVNCSATVAHLIARAFTPEMLAPYPNVDGVVAITHGTGCGMAAEGEPVDVLRRTIAGYARHANFAAVLLVGLGCEANQIRRIMEAGGLGGGPAVQSMTIQESGGTMRTVHAGVERLGAMLAQANDVRRQRVHASHLVLALQCGGSDGYSGITANPALGAAVDLLVRNGGSAVLSETPEIYGAEHLLVRRAATREVAERLLERIRWWEAYTEKNGGSMDNNPAPGNKAGGLTTILEKSLGSAAKGGTTNLVEVYKYAEQITAPGLVFMDTPGYDPVSATGQVAGGATVLAFTTGRGSAFGCKPVPSIKLATNTPLYERMTDDMDINCGPIADGEATIEEMGRRIFEAILATASGTRTKSELLGYGDYEFAPWQLGAVM